MLAKKRGVLVWNKKNIDKPYLYFTPKKLGDHFHQRLRIYSAEKIFPPYEYSCTTMHDQFCEILLKTAVFCCMKRFYYEHTSSHWLKEAFVLSQSADP